MNKKSMIFIIGGLTFRADRTEVERGQLWIYHKDVLLTGVMLKYYEIKYYFTNEEKEPFFHIERRSI